MSEDLVVQSHRGPYRVCFLGEVAEAVARAAVPRAHYVIDRRVAALYAEPLTPVLNAPSVLLVDALEENKSLDRFPVYVQHLVGRGIRRDHTLVAIGGGIVQDITCFLAATLLRGVEWSFVPTTLLAQADSCIGSKSSINCGDAKNILGTFTPPREILLTTQFLNTLDERDVRSGIGEMLKVHAIEGPAAFEEIAAAYPDLRLDRSAMIRFLRRSLEVKRRYIEQDEFDRGPRNVFNLGHSFGHAIETATNFAIPHGIAVTIGVDMANHIAVHLGVGRQGTFDRMHPALRANYREFETVPVPLDRFLAALSKDKKNQGADVTLVLLDKEGRVFKDRYRADAAFAAACQAYLDHVRAA